MKRLVLLIALVLGTPMLASCIPIGISVQNMYTQTPASTPAPR